MSISPELAQQISDIAKRQLANNKKIDDTNKVLEESLNRIIKICKEITYV